MVIIFFNYVKPFFIVKKTVTFISFYTLNHYLFEHIIYVMVVNSTITIPPLKLPALHMRSRVDQMRSSVDHMCSRVDDWHGVNKRCRVDSMDHWSGVNNMGSMNEMGIMMDNWGSMDDMGFLVDNWGSMDDMGFLVDYWGSVDNFGIVDNRDSMVDDWGSVDNRSCVCDSLVMDGLDIVDIGQHGLDNGSAVVVSAALVGNGTGHVIHDISNVSELRLSFDNRVVGNGFMMFVNYTGSGGCDGNECRQHQLILKKGH